MPDKSVQLKPWTEIAPYAFISLAGFVVSVALLFFMVWRAEKLVALGLTGRVYYVVLVGLGLSVAAFLFRVLQSYATYRGRQMGGVLVLGGPIVAVVLVVSGVR
jgi:hypothetical protein